MAELRDSIREALAGDQKNILLNLTEVNHIDSSGLGQLIGSYATVTGRGGHPVVSKCRPRPLIP
jgi:anti-sigma B factor antagonist